MSCYEWEGGTIVIPRSEWAKFKKVLMDEYNKSLDKAYEEAVKIYEAVKAKIKGQKMNLTANMVRSYIFDETRRQEEHYEWQFDRLSKYPSYKSVYPAAEAIENVVAQSMFDYANNKFHKPLKKGFVKATNKTNHYDCGEAEINLNDKAHSVRWDVPENNHACETAHEYAMAKVLFKALDNMKWTAQSGGTIVGNNEYNDGGDVGDGGNYAVMRYGNAEKKDLQRMKRMAKYR